MISKQTCLALIIVLMSTVMVQAQARLNRANKHMKNLDYTSAIEDYNKILEKDDIPEAKINLAECYRKIGDYANAEYWYGQVVRLPEVKPEHKLYYGQALQANGKCDLARDWYLQYVNEVPEDQRGQFLVRACDYEEELRNKNADLYEVTNVPFNSNVDDMSPMYHKKTIIFASERDKGYAIKRKAAWTGNPFLELYTVKAEEKKGEECGEFEYGSPDKFSKEINTKYHEAAVTFSSDGKQIFFTRNNLFEGKEGKDDEGTINLKVFSASSSGNDWTNLDGLPFNSDEYSVAHPTLTPDGTKLYFSSDMPGGFGGMDLYYSEKEGGRWGPPLNMGPAINTEGNEVFPYYHESGKLYFSSEGHIGLGGLDIHMMEDKGNNQWGMITNLGAPINSISDDFGIIFNEEGTCGHFTSDREGGAGGDDIYAFKKIASPVEIYVFDEATDLPIEGATVVDSCTGVEYTTGVDGKINLDQKMNMCCLYTASFEGYEDNGKEGCTKDIPIGQLVRVEIPLGKTIEFNIEGVVFDQNTGLPMEKATVTMISDCGDTEQTITTDETGIYNFKLIADCCYTLTASAENYLSEKADNQCTKDLTETTTLQYNFNLLPINASEDPGDDSIVDNGFEG